MNVGDIVTNGAFWGESQTPYLFKVLATDGVFNDRLGDVWVRQLNGQFEGDALTFGRKFLTVVQEAGK